MLPVSLLLPWRWKQHILPKCWVELAVSQVFIRLITNCLTCLTNSLYILISRRTASFWCAIRTCCWEKPLPWWCGYSCYCAWLYRLCTRTWYVNCYKSVCVCVFVFFKLLTVFAYIIILCAFIPQACTWKVYTKYQESSPRFSIWGECTTSVKLLNCQTLNYQS
jgi:hypothetical protein